jgi:hypothetical protein
MSLEEVRRIWVAQAEEKTKEIFDKYRERRDQAGGYGHEGLGVYGIYQERAARERMRLAVKLLGQAGLEITPAIVRKLTGRSVSASAIKQYGPRSRSSPPERQNEDLNQEEPPHIIKFPRRP